MPQYDRGLCSQDPGSLHPHDGPSAHKRQFGLWGRSGRSKPGLGSSTLKSRPLGTTNYDYMCSSWRLVGQGHLLLSVQKKWRRLLLRRPPPSTNWSASLGFWPQGTASRRGSGWQIPPQDLQRTHSPSWPTPSTPPRWHSSRWLLAGGLGPNPAPHEPGA